MDVDRYLSLLLVIGFSFLACENQDEDCPAIYSPVCGSDGVTYGNDCYAKNANVKEWIIGECDCVDESKISSDFVCYEIYAPVCGCDRKTYSNDCYAKNAGITEWVEGECE